MAILAHIGVGLGVDGGQTGTGIFNGTGVNLLIVGVPYYYGLSAALIASNVTDTSSNTYTLINNALDGQSVMKTALLYCASPTVTSNMRFTIGGVAMLSSYSSIFVIGLSESLATPFDHEDHTTSVSAGTSCTCPTGVTPSVGGYFTVSMTGLGGAAANTIGGGFTILDNIANQPTSEGGCMAYLIDPGTSLAKPTVSWTGSTNSAMAMASFKYAAAGGASAVPVIMNSYRQRRN